MTEQYFIGLDNGGSVIKAGLFDSNGNELATSKHNLKPESNDKGFVERKGTELFKANLICISELIRKVDIDLFSIKGISVTGHGNGFYPVNHEGKPMDIGVISTDTRAEKYIKKWNEDGTSELIQERAKQNPWAGQLAPILVWFKDNQPELLNRIKYAFPCADFIRYCLTGVAFGEYTNMSATALLNLETKEYDKDLLDAYGLSDYKHLLPPLCKAEDMCGTITDEVCSFTGLPIGIPVMGGLVDFAACPLATGIISPNQLSITTGTWSINLFLSKKPVASKEILMTTLYPVGDYYSVMEGSMTSASNLEWFIEEIMKSVLKDKEVDDFDYYSYCNESIVSIEPEDNPVFFLPYLYGTNVNASAKSCFFGLRFSHDIRYMLRAIYEGIVFSAMMHIEKLYKYMDNKPEKVRISGGISNSKAWIQIFADMLQMPIEVSKAKELGTMGAAICAAVGTGCFSSYEEAVNKFVKTEYIAYPNPDKKEVYEKKFKLYKSIVENMEPLWDEWNNLGFGID